MLLWANWVGSKWSRIFFLFFKLNNKQKTFERILLELLGTKYGFSAPFWSETKFSKIEKIEEKIDLRRKTFLRANFFDFSKNLFNFKKAQRSRILSPEALMECIRKVFVYTLLLKWKKIFVTILNPSNPPLFGAQKHVFLEKTHLGSISILPKTQQRLTKNVRKTT